MSNTTQQQRLTAPRSQREFKQYLGFDKKFGYLHELRKLNTGTNTFTVRISVPVGQSDSHNDNIRYINFELYVKPADALMSFFEHRDAIADESRKVTIRFSCSNVYPKAHIAQNGKYEGEAVPTMGGNLSYLHLMKVDGEVVHGYRADEPVPEERIDTETGEVLPFTPDQSQRKQRLNSANREDQPQREAPPLDVYEAEMMASDNNVETALVASPQAVLEESSDSNAQPAATDEPAPDAPSTPAKRTTKRSSRSKVTRSQG